MKDFETFYNEMITTACMGSPSNYVGTRRKKKKKHDESLFQKPQTRLQKREDLVLKKQLKNILGGDNSPNTIQ